MKFCGKCYTKCTPSSGVVTPSCGVTGLEFNVYKQGRTGKGKGGKCTPSSCGVTSSSSAVVGLSSCGDTGLDLNVYRKGRTGRGKGGGGRGKEKRKKCTPFSCLVTSSCGITSSSTVIGLDFNVYRKGQTGVGQRVLYSIKRGHVMSS